MLNLNTKRSWDNYDFDKPSKAVIACNDKNGIVLFAVGGHLLFEMKEVGLHTTEDLGITPPHAGVWVWKGIYVWVPGSWEHPQDGYMEPSGTFWPPSVAEWKCIKQGKCPWDDRYWKLNEDTSK